MSLPGDLGGKYSERGICPVPHQSFLLMTNQLPQKNARNAKIDGESLRSLRSFAACQKINFAGRFWLQV